MTLSERAQALSDIERMIFGRERKKEEVFGVYRRLIAAQATDSKVRGIAQDGGVVTALLLHGLGTKRFSRAVVSCTDPKKSLYPVPKLASNPAEILACAGTRYSYSPNLVALRSIKEHGTENVAFVGTPCQINALRKIQLTETKKYSSVNLFIGLMCSECFDYETLFEQHLHKELGLKLEDIIKINIKGKMIITMKDRQTHTLPLKEVKQYSRKSCRNCSDFSSELADISIGGLGLQDWSYVIVRSESGEQFFSSAEKAGIIQTRNAEEEVKALDLLRKLSIKKNKNFA